MKYTVKRGDTLYGIALNHDVTVNAIVSTNGLKDPDFIKVGQVLEIPTSVTDNNDVKKAVIACLDAVEKLPEYQNLCKLLGV